MAVDVVDENEGRTDGSVFTKGVPGWNGNRSLFCDESVKNISPIIDTIDKSSYPIVAISDSSFSSTKQHTTIIECALPILFELL
jgi:hypothetical protein